MISIAVIDDNILFRKSFCGFLDSLGNYKVAFHGKSVDELISFLQNTKKSPMLFL